MLKPLQNLNVSKIFSNNNREADGGSLGITISVFKVAEAGDRVAEHYLESIPEYFDSSFRRVLGGPYLTNRLKEAFKLPNNHSFIPEGTFYRIGPLPHIKLS